MNIILIGPPGAGKGTQGDNLVKDFDLFKISTGDLLRKEVEKQSELGIEIKHIIEQGLLASDKIINNLIELVLSNNNYSNRLIFDGYPRNLSQVKSLSKLMKKYNQEIGCVFSLKVDRKTIVKRILGRQVCSRCGSTFNEFFNPSNIDNHVCDLKFLQKRSDDNEETILKRFETYLKDTLPIINYYRDQRLLQEIDGMNNIATIYAKIRSIINSLET